MKDLIAYASDAMNKKDWPQAVSRWQRVFMVFKDQTPPEAYIMLSMAYRFLGQYAQADEIITLGMKTLPVNLSILHEYAEIAKAKKDWPEVAKRLKIVQSINEQLNTIQKNIAESQIGYLRYKLHNLGFTKKALSDFKSLLGQQDNPHVRNLAAWELALWHADAQRNHGAEKCLDMLAIVKTLETKPSRLRQATVLEAETLDLMGKREQASEIIHHALSQNAHPELFLAAANLEPEHAVKACWINKALRACARSELTFSLNRQPGYFQGMPWSTPMGPKLKQHHNHMKVSVLLDARQDTGFLQTALESLSAQTWTNLEIIVVVDASQQGALGVVQSHAYKDPRLTMLTACSDMSPYGAMNLALQQSTGILVTCQKANEWVHPEKIEIQASSLLKDSRSLANISQYAAITPGFHFLRPITTAGYIHHNPTSLLFHKKHVSRKFGHWDDVHLGADQEMVKRLMKVFGNRSIHYLRTGPLSFRIETKSFSERVQKYTNKLLAGSAYNEYLQSSDFFHNATKSFYYNFPQEKRPFPAPYSVVCTSNDKENHSRHFDVIIASQFTIRGGNNISLREEIKCQKKNGLKTGLVQMFHYDYPPLNGILPEIRDCINGQSIQVITYEETVSCDLLVVRYPPVLQEVQACVPNIVAGDVRVIVNIPPKRMYEHDSEIRYTIQQCQNNLQRYFGQAGTWHPIGPLVRNALREHHADDLKCIHLSDEDWVNIIHLNEWRRSSRPAPGKAIRIGKHGRDHYVKWPDNPEELLSVYPDVNEFEVNILGGAEIPKNILGRLPGNWNVLAYGAEHPRDFLSKLDVYVHYTHPRWVESFGRSVIEAMAVGVPVVLPHEYEVLFGDAGVYARPHEVQACVHALMANDSLYDAQVKKAWRHVEQNFGHSKHLERLKKANACLRSKLEFT